MDDGAKRPRGAGRSDAVLSAHVRADVHRARELQLESIRLARESAALWRHVARMAADAGLSLHDIARLLDVSPARVRDLLDDEFDS